MTVQRKEEISIRFNQFYEGYLSPEERLNYQYSSVLMELYQINENAGIRGDHTLLIDCQGCNRSLAGARSARISFLLRYRQKHFRIVTRSLFIAIVSRVAA